MKIIFFSNCFSPSFKLKTVLLFDSWFKIFCHGMRLFHFPVPCIQAQLLVQCYFVYFHSRVIYQSISAQFLNTSGIYY